jgi:hypothetical protein
MTWRSTFVYGEPKAQDRHEMWTLIPRIKLDVEEPWLMVGDFNETMWQHKHISATRRNERQMTDFREVLSQCNLYDLGFVGLPWTYNNKQKGIKNVRVRLDRAVACPTWSSMFPQTVVRHIVSSRSDHYPLLVSLNKDADWGKDSKTIRYEMMWEREASLGEEIEVAWNGHEPASCLGNVQNKLKSTMECLTSWSKSKFGAVSKEIIKLKKRLEWLQSKHFSRNRKEIEGVNRRLDELLLREEIMWRQRSRVSWLKHGDQNTKFFHRKASWRAKKNRIWKLKKVDGRVVDKQSDMEI